MTLNQVISKADIDAGNLTFTPAADENGADYDACVENIDIGGPAMIRAAAKNHAFVAVCVDFDDLDAVLAQLDAHDGATTFSLRRALAAKAYARTAAYDAAIANWLGDVAGEEFPHHLAVGGEKAEALRYGENPHQAAAFYRLPAPRTGVATARHVQGKELSYNNINDTDAAFELAAEFGVPHEGAAENLGILGGFLVGVLIMDLAPADCKAGMFGLYYLIRDVIVSVAAFGGAFLWQASPQINFMTAFVFGVIGTLGFAILGRDVHVDAQASVRRDDGPPT